MTSLPPATIFIFILFSFTVGSYSAESKYKINRYYRSLPVKPSVVIMSKYVYFLLMAIFILSFQYLLMHTMTLIGFTNYYSHTLYDFSIMFVFVIIMFCSIIPIYFIVGSKYRAAVFIMIFIFWIFSLEQFAVYDANGYYSVYFNESILVFKHYLNAEMYWIIAIFSPVLIVCSYYVSLVFYKKRDII